MDAIAAIERQPTAARAGAGTRRLEVLVAIASFGTAQDHFLEHVVAQFHRCDVDCRVVVLTNRHKPVDNAEVLVGLPSKNPYSLPFAHRALFTKHAHDYDLFVYVEDDTPITARNIQAFLDVQQSLCDDEILGFVRSETDPSGTRHIVSANHFFRWLPQSTIVRGPYRLASYSNQHSGCFIATRAQLLRAIASGGFMVAPHADRYDMPETAASDIYTQCGLKRVLCLSQLEDFIVPHMSNKYFSRWGLPLTEFAAQARALAELPASAPTTSLFNPETRAPGFRWSKHLYRRADLALLDMIPRGAKRILSVGATMGADEAELQRRGLRVDVVPLDAVFGDSLRRQGLTVHLDASGWPRETGAFDVVLAADALHLFESPLAWLRSAARYLRPGGEIVGSTCNTTSAFWPLKDWRAGRRGWLRPDHARIGAHPMNRRRLLRLCGEAGLEPVETAAFDDGWPSLARAPAWVRRTLGPRILYRLRRGP